MLALRILDVKYQLVENARRCQVQANKEALGQGGAQVHAVKTAQAEVVVVEEASQLGGGVTCGKNDDDSKKGYELACEKMLQPVTCLHLFQLPLYGQQHPGVCERP